MSDELVTVSVTIPRHRLAQLYRYVSTLAASDESFAGPEVRSEWDDGPIEYEARFDADVVRRNYAGGVSKYWRPFLHELAAHPGEWVDWHRLCNKIGLSPTQASGMLGAAERRCKGMPPYDKEQGSEGYRFRMPAETASLIHRLAAGE